MIGVGVQADSGPSCPRHKRQESRISSETPSASQVICVYAHDGCGEKETPLGEKETPLREKETPLGEKRPHLAKNLPLFLMLSLLWQLLSQAGEGAGGAGASQEARRARRERRGYTVGLLAHAAGGLTGRKVEPEKKL